MTAADDPSTSTTAVSHRLIRSRWAAIGAAVAVTPGAVTGGGGGGGSGVDAYTKTESDTRYAAKADTYTKAQVGATTAPKTKLVSQTVTGLSAVGSTISYEAAGIARFDPNDASGAMALDLSMPIGAKLIQVRLIWRDASSSSMSFYLFHRMMVVGADVVVTPHAVNNVQSSVANVGESVHDLPSTTPGLEGNASWILNVFAPAHTGSLALPAVTHTYEIAD